MNMIAHRGHHNKTIPENTIQAFNKALELGADGIETDLRLSLDEKIVLFHDAKIEDKKGKKKAVEALTYGELKEIKADIPTLEELLEVVDTKATLILEIKYDEKTYKRLCELLVRQIEDKLEWVEVSCFDKDDVVLEYMHRINKDIKFHKLIDKKSILLDETMEDRYAFVNYFDIDVNLYDEVLKKGLLKRHKVIFWTVRNHDLTEAIKTGLYGVMKDEIA